MVNSTYPRTDPPAPARPPAASLPHPLPRPAAGSLVPIRYLERSPVRVRGPVTGFLYEFSAAAPLVQVDTRDAERLLRTGFFSNGSG